MGKKKAKPPDELEAILRFCESQPIGGNAIPARCRQIRGAVKAGNAKGAAVAAFRLAEAILFVQQASGLMAELNRFKEHNAATVRQQTAAAARKVCARELAREIPGWKNRSVPSLAKEVQPLLAARGLRYGEKEIALGTVENYLQGIHSPQG